MIRFNAESNELVNKAVKLAMFQSSGIPTRQDIIRQVIQNWMDTAKAGQAKLNKEASKPKKATEQFSLRFESIEQQEEFERLVVEANMKLTGSPVRPASAIRSILLTWADKYLADNKEQLPLDFFNGLSGLRAA